MAITIAIRYSAARRQFGPPGGAEQPVLEYPLQVDSSCIMSIMLSVISYIFQLLEDVKMI